MYNLRAAEEGRKLVRYLRVYNPIAGKLYTVRYTDGRARILDEYLKTVVIQ